MKIRRVALGRKSRSAVSVVVFPEWGCSAAMSSDPCDASVIPHSAAVRASMLPASSSCVIDIGTGGSQFQPHQPIGMS
jgi:hypothetical protein